MLRDVNQMSWLIHLHDITFFWTNEFQVELHECRSFERDCDGVAFLYDKVWIITVDGKVIEWDW